MEFGGFMMAERRVRRRQARLEDNSELKHELVHPRRPGSGDGEDVAGLTHHLEDLSLHPGGESQDELGRKRYLHSRKGHFLIPKLADLSDEISQLAVKGSGDCPIQPLLQQRLADRWVRPARQPHEFRTSST